MEIQEHSHGKESLEDQVQKQILAREVRVGLGFCISHRLRVPWMLCVGGEHLEEGYPFLLGVEQARLLK